MLYLYSVHWLRRHSFVIATEQTSKSAVTRTVRPAPSDQYYNIYIILFLNDNDGRGRVDSRSAVATMTPWKKRKTYDLSRLGGKAILFLNYCALLLWYRLQIHHTWMIVGHSDIGPMTLMVWWLTTLVFLNRNWTDMNNNRNRGKWERDKSKP